MQGGGKGTASDSGGEFALNHKILELWGERRAFRGDLGAWRRLGGGWEEAGRKLGGGWEEAGDEAGRRLGGG